MDYRLSKVIKIGLLAGLSLVIVGCSQQQPSTPPPSSEITLQWWGVFLDADVVEPLIAEYESQNPGVKIDYANRWPGGKWESASQLYQDELDRVLKEANPVVVPDIFMVANTWAGNYENFAAPAPTSEIDANTVRSAFHPAVAKDFAREQVYGLPLWMDTLAILYNKNLLSAAAVSAPPTNWVDFRDLALDLTKRTGGTITQAGFAGGTAVSTSFGVELLNLLFLQNGVAMTNSLGDASFSTDVDSIAALQFYKSFVGNSGSWDSSFENDALAFMQGDLAMLAATSWRYLDILTFNEKYNLNLNIGVSTMPQLQGQEPPVINWATYWGNMVSAQRPNSAASWKFLNWMTQPTQLAKLNTNLKTKQKFFGILYPRTDMAQELQSDQYLRVFNSALPTADSWYMVDGLAVRTVFQELIDKTSINQSSISEAENNIQRIISDKGTL